MYTAPFIFIPIENVRIEDRGGKKIVKDKFAVSRITTSEEKVILSLNIVNQKGQTVFSYGKNPCWFLPGDWKKICSFERWNVPV